MITYKPPASSKFKRPLMYLSGGFTVPLEKEKSWLKRSGCTHRCYSYAYVRENAIYYDKRVEGCMEIDIDRNIGIMMDSSAFTFHGLAKTGRARGLSEDQIVDLRNKVMADYAKFIKENKGRFDFFVNFDYIKHAPTVYKVQKKLEKQGILPMPMFHGDSGFTWLKKYLDEGYDYIGLGSDKNLRNWNDRKRYRDRAFNLAAKYKNVRFHGFAATGYHTMFMWPFYSVDSSSWAKISGFGLIIIINPVNGQIQYVHVSDKLCIANKNQYSRMEESVKKSIRNWVEGHGFDFDKVRSNPYERGLFNAWVFSHIHSLVMEPQKETKWRSIL